MSKPERHCLHCSGAIRTGESFCRFCGWPDRDLSDERPAPPRVPSVNALAAAVVCAALGIIVLQLAYCDRPVQAQVPCGAVVCDSGFYCGVYNGKPACLRGTPTPAPTRTPSPTPVPTAPPPGPTPTPSATPVPGAAPAWLNGSVAVIESGSHYADSASGQLLFDGHLVIVPRFAADGKTQIGTYTLQRRTP